MRIAIVYNEPGLSHYDVIGEKEASILETVEPVHQSLLDLEHEVLRIQLVSSIEEVNGKFDNLDFDLIFNLFEGFNGLPETEADFVAIMADRNMPFTGCPSQALRLSLDKAKTKVLLKAAKIKTADFQVLNTHSLNHFQLNFPCIVKPRCDDASHGLTEESVVNDSASLKNQVIKISDFYGDNALVEEFIDGREFNITVLGNTNFSTLPASEIVYSLPEGRPRILTFSAKWLEDSPYFVGTKAVCPAPISSGEQEKIAQIALAAFHATGCRGYARVDMRLDKEEQLNVLEVNPNPDISPGTGAARQAEAAGMTYTKFIDKIIKLALHKN